MSKFIVLSLLLIILISSNNALFQQMDENEDRIYNRRKISNKELALGKELLNLPLETLRLLGYGASLHAIKTRGYTGNLNDILNMNKRELKILITSFCNHIPELNSVEGIKNTLLQYSDEIRSGLFKDADISMPTKKYGGN